MLLNTLQVGQVSRPVEPREYSYSRLRPCLEGAVALALDVQVKVVRARTLAHRDRPGRLSYSFKSKAQARTSPVATRRKQENGDQLTENAPVDCSVCTGEIDAPVFSAQ